MKRGFTLVELFVVIGIIAILMGVLLATFGSSTESARSAKCLVNLKSLATAANSYAMKNGTYPLAGSVEYIKIAGTTLTYREKPGWISWLSCDGQYGVNTAGNDDTDDRKNSNISYPTTHQSVETCPYYGTGVRVKDEWALKNGSIWSSIGKKSSVYVCPTHAKSCKSEPLFSYVMSAKFVYDISQGQKPLGLGAGDVGVRYGSLDRAERILMFADIDGTGGGGNAGKTGGSNPKDDAVLNYKATVNGEEYGSAWDGDAESIGFTHKGSQGKMFANVVFADGHTEKLMCPSDGSALDAYMVTALLCEGKDMTARNGKYTAIKEDD